MTQQPVAQKPFYALDPCINESADLLYQNSRFLPNLYNFLTTAVQPPYSLSIHGNWGTGKTSLMLALKAQFETAEYPVFWFNPWEFEQVDDILHAFLSQLTRKSNAKDKGAKAVKAAGIMGLTLLGTSIDLVARLATGNKLNLKEVDYISDKATANFKQTFEQFEGRYVDQHPLEVLRDDFKQFTCDVAKNYDNKPLIVFIDDLDRCLPENALTLLEAIKNLFVIPGAEVMFISGIDTHIARQFIIERYKGLDPTFAYSYFKKIFNFTVTIPSLTSVNYEDLLQKRYDEMKPRLIAAIDGDLPAVFERLMTIDLRTLLIKGGIKSIRQIYNIFQSCCFFFMMNPSKMRAGPNIVYLALVILKESWPDLFEDLQKEALRDSGNSLWQFLDTFLKKTPNTLAGPFIQYMIQSWGNNSSLSSLVPRILLEI